MGGINKEVDMTILERTNPVFNTAKMTLYQLSAVGDPDAAAIAKELGLTMEETQNSKTTTAGSEQILAGEITMDIRFNIMSRLAEESGCPVHVDLPCGYTPRAIQFSKKGLRFVGLDLPAAITEAEPAIMSLIEPKHRSLVKFAGVDATNYESLDAALDDEEGKICITTEGLLMYFTDSETGVLCDNIRRLLQKHGGVWITADPEIAPIHMMVLKALCGDRFMEIMANSRKQAEDKSDIIMSEKSMLVMPQDIMGSMNKAMAFLSGHGLKAERLVLFENMPELKSLNKLNPQQAEAIKELMKKFAFWKITVSENARKLDTAKVGGQGFDASAELKDGRLNLALLGRLDTITAPNLLAFYEKHREEISAVTVDCGKLEYISSAGLRVLMIMQKGCEGGVSLYGTNSVVRDILEQTGFDSIFSVSE